MNRSLRLRRVPVTTASVGRVHVATIFDDADRGMIQSGAAELIAASAQNAILEYSTTAPGTEDGVLITVSYLDRYGRPGGYALIAALDDADEAEHVARDWMRVLRSRRVTIVDVPALCWGGQRAQTMIGGTRPDYVVGQPLGAVQLGAVQLRAGPPGTGNTTVVADLDQVPDGAVIALPAHGASLAVRAEAAARGMRVIDATCPLVASVHADAATYASRGDTVVVIGDSEHAATRVLAEQAGDNGIVVSDAGDVAALAGVDPDRVSFVIDPGMRTEKALAILAVLRRRFPMLRGHHLDALCDAASDRARAIESVAATNELMLVVTGSLDDMPVRTGPVRAVTCLADLDADVFDGVTTVGLLSTLSAPAGLTDGVLRALSGLGPLSTVWFGAHTRGPASPAGGGAAAENAALRPAPLPA
jgi:4-hydroxy-3-methylbut-2-en-1-yl diphosphate reductase